MMEETPVEILETPVEILETPVETPKTPVEIPETPVEMLELLRQQPDLTLAEVAAVLGKSTSAVERAARKLRHAGRLRHVGPRNKGHWEVVF